DDEGVFRLYGGCVCFPSHWDLRQKIGRTMAEIHSPVPGLNETLGRQIDGFLSRIGPGVSWERSNWGLSRSPELNLHPSRDVPRLDAGVGLDEVWFRLEEQSLVALPASGGILFGIRLVIRPMAEIKSDPAARQGMIRALRTMPDAMAAYKGIAPARGRLLELMENE
ncbi:MAG TPA: heme-dependent oxidative N-demethylase subunit alpha family protein, partial [Luteolibacter sp.]|nr:heme-dependent oxidative N-demethylase subunit alpha family protein [Luteolibacter sp.]